MILVIDNYDSFVHNLARYFRLEGAQTQIIRNDALCVDDILARKAQAILLSPGPKTPKQAGVSLALLNRLAPEMPVLGVCLGHQCLVETFGGATVRARRPMHGRVSTIRHDEGGLFKGAPSPLKVGRYHSLVSILGDNDALAPCAWSEEDEIMAVRHVTRPWFGVQFHPESLLTEYGQLMIRNFLGCIK